MKTLALIFAVAFLLQGPLCAFAATAPAAFDASGDRTAHDCCADTGAPVSIPGAPVDGDGSGTSHCDFHCATLSQMITSADAPAADLFAPVPLGPAVSDLHPDPTPLRGCSIPPDDSFTSGNLSHQTIPLLI